MTSYMRSLDASLDLQDNNILQRVIRVLVFGQRVRRRSERVLDMVPRWGASHMRVAVNIREI
jgi:hypothetical protein